MNVGRLILIVFAMCLSVKGYSEESINNEDLELINQLLMSGDQQLARQKLRDVLTPLLTNDMSAAIFDTHAAISLSLRKSRDFETAKYLELLYLSDYRETLSMETRYHLLKFLCYDYMALARFEHVRQVLTAQIETITKWQPLSEDGVTSKANLLHIYGQLLVRQKNIPEALEYFFEAESLFSRLNPQHPSIFTIQVVVGEAYLEGFQYEKAEVYLRKALAIFPAQRLDGRSYVAMVLAKSLLKQEKKDAALQVINDYLANPVDPREDYFLAFSLTHLEILRALQLNDEALKQAKQTMQLAEKVGNPDYINEARQHLAVMLVQTGQPKKGLELIELSINGKRDIRDYLSLGALKDYVTILEANGLYEQALTVQKRYQEVFVVLDGRIDEIHIADLEAQRALADLKQKQQETEFNLEFMRQKERMTRMTFRAYGSTILILILGIVIIIMFMRRLKAHNSLLHRLSIIDPLTNIPNRLAFSQELELDWHRCVLIADLDFLKYYNDEFGHARGDHLLQRFSHLMASNLAPNDKVFRIGGDEFAVLSANMNSHQADNLMSRVIESIQSEGFDKVDVSYGIASITDVQDSQKRMALADTRMYEMKTKRKKGRHPDNQKSSA